MLIPIALSILGALAPHAGTIVGGLAGMLAGPKAEDAAKAIVDKTTSIFGTTDPEVIKAQIAADQSKAQIAIAQLQEATKEYEVEVSDRKDARARDLAIRQMVGVDGTPAGTNPRANVMLVGVFIMLISILVGSLLYRASIPDTVMAMLSMIAGGLVGNLTQAFNFEFGSSRSSSDKQATLNEIAKK